MSGLRDGTRIAIAGRPTPEEIAAVVVALDEALKRSDNSAAGRSGWLEAARREAVGGLVVRARTELSP
ncbi:MAG: hypothetical protein GEU74_05715 [Nitriliruptorales bacterium]|nr:hypothetical protein [Nitriliruptorales bacterium]